MGFYDDTELFAMLMDAAGAHLSGSGLKNVSDIESFAGGAFIDRMLRYDTWRQIRRIADALETDQKALRAEEKIPAGTIHVLPIMGDH